jgi:dihydroxyacetone kinase-like protein
VTGGRVPGGGELARRWLLAWAEEVHARRTWLTELDAAIGDGDHGINLDRGLAAVANDLADSSDARPGAVLTAAGRRLMGVVGGASGALYGRAFIRAGEALDAALPDDTRLGEIALAAAIEAIEALGKATTGDKTLLDALAPALEALRAPAVGEGVVARHARAVAAAEAGSDATIPLVARKGRASYLGDRSAGHRDPGSASAAMLVRSLAHAIEGS